MGEPNLVTQELLADMQLLINKYQNKVTRDIYRKEGAFPERTWGKFFPTFRAFVKAASEPSVNNTQTVTTGLSQETQEFKGDVWNITLPKTDIHTLEQLLEYFEVDTALWDVERFVVNSWQMGYKDKNGDADKLPLYQVKATLVKKKNIEAARNEIEDLKREAKEFAYKPLPRIEDCSVKLPSGNSLELLVPDLHAGKFAWGKETLDADYDTPTAIETYKRSVATLVYYATKNYKFDEIVLGVGNDILNSDNYNSQTTKGTIVNSDTRYPKTYKAVRKMLVETIDALRGYCDKVIVKVVPGNHDAVTTFTLGDSLECWFHNYDDVEIDNSPSPHKFYRWGNVLLGMTHGDKGKKADYGLWLATEKPRDFGETLYREVHIGHTHGIKVDEKFGVRVRTFAALCPPDFWHASNFFINNLRQAEAIVWNKDLGRVAEFIHTEE